MSNSDVSKTLDFDWSSLEVALEGLSYVDFPSLKIENKEQAKQFLKSYGYDPSDEQASEEIWRIYFESVSFIQRELLNQDDRDLPKELCDREQQNDLLRILVDASKNSEKGRWTCSILRVMHIIALLDNDIRMENFHHAREQIFNRFDQYVLEGEMHRWYFMGQDEKVPLTRYFKKMRKDRNSLIIKLLAKPHMMPDEIYDSLGIRFVTENRFQAYRLMQAILKSGVIAPSHVQPSRSVNTLIDFQTLKEMIEELKFQHSNNNMSDSQVMQSLQEFEKDDFNFMSMKKNPFSSPWYRAIQISCRQLIHSPDPTYKFWQETSHNLKKEGISEEILKKIPVLLREKKSFYYPFEIQITDKASYLESIRGRSRHRDYKAKQRLMARNRVLRDLV